MINKSYALAALMLTVTTGCSSTRIENKNDFIYNPAYVQVIEDAEFMPTKAMLSPSKTKAALVPAEILSPLAQSALVAPVVDAKISQLMNDAGVKIIDRETGDTLKQELKAYEASGRSTGLALDVADVVLSPVIVSATHEAIYTPGRYEKKSKKSNKYEWISAKCSHKTEVSGYIKIYDMPSMAQRKQIELERNISFDTKTNRRDCAITIDMLNDFIVTTTKEAIRNKANNLKNEFSSHGYVLEYRSLDDTHYIKINQGRELGLVQNVKIEFIRTFENKDSLTGDIARNEFVLGYGEVTDLIHSNSAWVAVSDSLASQIKRGDKAKVVFKTGYFL